MAYKETDTCWHILTVTRGGVVSILQNMDAPTAREAYLRLCPNKRPVKYVNGDRDATNAEISAYFEADCRLRNGALVSSSSYDREFKTVSVLGPRDAELDHARDAKPTVIDVAPYIRRSQAA